MVLPIVIIDCRALLFCCLWSSVIIEIAQNLLNMKLMLLRYELSIVFSMFPTPGWSTSWPRLGKMFSLSYVLMRWVERTHIFFSHPQSHRVDGWTQVWSWYVVEM